MRDKIDILDNEIQRLLCERFQLVKKIGDEKKRLGITVQDGKREGEILEKIQLLPYEKEVKSAVFNLYEEMFVFSKEIQNS